jgi:hypothetical protein
MSGAKTHKGSANPILNFYYTFPYVLLIACAGNEFFLVCCYLLKWSTGPAAAPLLWQHIATVCFPIFVFKQAMNFVQLYDAAGEIALIDYREHKAKQTDAAK